MPFLTKHFVLATIVLVLVLIGLMSWLILRVSDDRENLETPEISVNESTTPPAELVEDTPEDTRTALIEKLRGRDVPEEIPHSTSSAEELETTRLEILEGALPVGDGSVAVAPEAGSVFLCTAPTESGVDASLPWIEDGYWFSERKVGVSGSVSLTNDVSIDRVEGARIITANGLPAHPVGTFPIATADPAYQYDSRAASATPQDVLLQLPANPVRADVPSCVPAGMVGVSLNGVAIYSGVTKDGRDAQAHEMLDACGGHPDEHGIYHYHGESSCLFSDIYEGAPNTLLGYALDGFGIFANTENGEPVTNDDLDACHGHEHVIPWNGVRTSMYHYHMTDSYPYTPSCFAGTPVDVASADDLPPADEQTATASEE